MSGRKPERFLGRLTGRTAIVTGAGSSGEGVGTGKAMAVLFAGEGARICLVDRDQAAAENTLKMIEEIGGDAFIAIGDVTNEGDCARFVAETLDRYGAVDTLVNNVGIANGSRGLDAVDIDAWQRVFDVNLRSAVLMSKYTIPEMVRAGGGAIVNIVSIAGLFAYGTTDYGPSKAALLALTRETALLHGRQGIRANAIAPGHVYTPMSGPQMSEEMRGMRTRAGPLNIEGDAWDVAYAALYLVSDEARLVTGTCLPIDAGVTVVGTVRAAMMMSDTGS